MSTLNVLPGLEVKNEWSYTSTSPICLQIADCDSSTSDTVAYIEAFHNPL